MSTQHETVARPTCPMVEIFGVVIPEIFVTSFDGLSVEAYHAWNGMDASERAKWIETEPIETIDPPRPCYRSVWDVYGLRRRPRRS